MFDDILGKKDENGNFSNPIFEIYSTFSEKEKTENACDFIAITLLFSNEHLINSVLNESLSKTELLSSILFSSFAIEMFKIMQINCIVNDSKALETLEDHFKKRWAILVAEATVSCNTNDFPFNVSKEELQEACSIAGEHVPQLMRVIGEAYQELADHSNCQSFTMNSRVIPDDKAWHLFLN